ANFGTFESAYRLEPLLRHLAELAKRIQINGRPAAEDPAVRQKLAQFHIEIQAMTYNGFRQLTKQSQGIPPGPESSMSKLAASDITLRLVHFASELLGPYSQVARGEKHGLDDGVWSHQALGSRLYTLAGGTVEIQRNILGERVLGLPKN
ncbi:MAG: acyl-CoA dehydrogenase family protein, partial [Candidatus Binatia bacterium]